MSVTGRFRRTAIQVHAVSVSLAAIDASIVLERVGRRLDPLPLDPERGIEGAIQLLLRLKSSGRSGRSWHDTKTYRRERDWASSALRRLLRQGWEPKLVGRRQFRERLGAYIAVLRKVHAGIAQDKRAAVGSNLAEEERRLIREELRPFLLAFAEATNHTIVHGPRLRYGRLSLLTPAT